MNRSISILSNREETTTMARHSEASIARRAYEIWEKQGKPHGRDREHWLQAEAELGSSIVADPVVLKPVKAARADPPKAPAAAPKTVAAKVSPKLAEAVTAPARTKSAPKKK
jgi:hypothetical protein